MTARDEPRPAIRRSCMNFGCSESLYLRLKAMSSQPIKKFSTQRSNAYLRGIEWEFTLEDWWRVWEESGRWDERGILGHQYVMARNGDQGPYSPSNVRIVTSDENLREFYQAKGRHRRNGWATRSVYAARDVVRLDWPTFKGDPLNLLIELEMDSECL